MKRIKITHGSARVSDNISEKGVEALNKLGEAAYNMILNKPLSCAGNIIHFTKKIGKDEICMYCGSLMRKFLGETEIGSNYFEMIDFSKERKHYPIEKK